MPEHPDRQPEYREYLAWDVPTRLFHWINALAGLGLIASGLEILTGSLLGLSPDGKIALKSAHVLLGYVMAANLLWRFVWAFFGNRYARWRSILPGGAGFAGALKAYVASFLTGEPQPIYRAQSARPDRGHPFVSPAAGPGGDRSRPRRHGFVLAALWSSLRRMGRGSGC